MVAYSDPLEPIRAALATFPDRWLTGISPGLHADDRPGWVPAAEVVSGAALGDMLDAAARHWRAPPHAAAALAFKHYSYWLALPAVVGYAVARRVPLMRPDAVMARWSTRPPFLRIATTRVEVAVLPSDPCALPGHGADPSAGVPSAPVRVVPDEDALLAALRASIMDDHLAPMLELIKGRVHLGHRTLWGSLASGVAHGVSRTAPLLPGSALATANQMLAALDLAELVELEPAEDRQPGLHVRRRTCCLAFTLPEPKVCIGCCIQRVACADAAA